MRNLAAVIVIGFAVGQLPFSLAGLMMTSGIAVQGSGYLLTLYELLVAVGVSPSLERGVCPLFADESPRPRGAAKPLAPPP